MLLALALCLELAAAQTAAKAAPPPDLDAWAAGAMRTFDVPGLAVAIVKELVEEKKIERGAPVIRYLPAFAMWDPHVTRELTVRDLLAHRSGLELGAGDLLWWPPSTCNRKDLVLKPARGGPPHP